MAQFDVFAPKAARVSGTLFVISLQSDLLSRLESVVVGALKRFDGAPRIDRLTPLLIVNGERVLFMPTDLITLPVRALGRPVANLAADRERIIAALDVLFSGI